jgi:hypothetical protein
MQVTYVYIDDDSKDRTDGTVQGFKQDNFIDITPSQPQSTWEEQISFIENSEKEDKLDGLILDLRLDDYPNADKKKANYRGTSLAQEIRTRQKEGILKPFPIVLFSGNDKVVNSLENSGKDLFDICIGKETINDTSYFEFRLKLNALAEGYKFISSAKFTAQNILNIDESLLDERFVSELYNLAEDPCHVISRFLINELISKQGLLINEQVLAARLGIDIELSSDWNKVKESLLASFYNGVFSMGWSRWWMPKIEIWWIDVIKADSYLRSTSASQRINLIKEKLGLSNLQTSQKIEKADSEEYWTVCLGYNRPLDPVDGLIIDGQENLYPWQDPEYVSIDAALKKKNVDLWKRVAKIEEERLAELQEQFKKPR